MIDGSDDELRDAANAHANHEENATPSDFGNDAAVDDDDDHTDCRHDRRHCERVVDTGHLEEIGSVR